MLLRAFLLCYNLHIVSRLTNQFRTIFFAPVLPPRLTSSSPEQGLDVLQLHSCFQLLTLVLCCPFLPMDRPRLFQQHLSSQPAGIPLSCPPPRQRPRAAKITSVTQDRSCSPFHLSPCLYFKDLLPPRLLLLSSPSAHPHASRPVERGHGG